MPRVPIAAVCLPPLIAASVAFGLVLAWTVDARPLWPEESLTLSEAVVLRDRAEVIRLARLGQDLNRKSGIRAGFIEGRDALLLTPVAAAVEGRQPQLLLVLRREGARPTVEEKEYLIERAAALNLGEAIPLLRAFP